MVTERPGTTAFWNGRRVFVTGHTGFKGGWLCLWLHSMGAQVHGYALPPPTEPSLFHVASVETAIANGTTGDIRDYDSLYGALAAHRPEIVFHLAAQPLVRRSYREPVETYGVNVLGVVHVLEAVRSIGTVKAVVNVTTDKCYEDQRRPSAYREGETIGGHDPYSSSKACAELITAAYRRSFLASAGTAVATARAGNVIGGGDWAADRLLPDFFRALASGTPLAVRSPHAVRPWQHVLEPLSGYLALAERLYGAGAPFAEPWNFGPGDEDVQSVGWIVDYLASREPGASWTRESAPQPHETNYLRLDSGKAQVRLRWRPRWSVQEALDKTLEWHRAWRGGLDMRKVTLSQIDDYLAAGTRAGCGAI